MRLRIPPPVSGGLMLSYTCNAACGHCMYACSPKWPADWITEEDLEATLRALAGKIQPGPWGPESMGLNHGLHFSGGEPFLNFPLLMKAAGRAHELGIPSLIVETNCIWAREEEETREKLLALRKLGVIGIMISINPFYLEHVPFERSERAIRISREVFGANTAVYQLEYYRLFKQLGIRGRLSFAEFLELPAGRTLSAAGTTTSTTTTTSCPATAGGSRWGTAATWTGCVKTAWTWRSGPCWPPSPPATSPAC
jgi:MoaA/NifB/PqqE/SkfB family radical SAM enzyme